MYFDFLNLPVRQNHYHPLQPYHIYVLNSNTLFGQCLKEDTSKSCLCCSAAFTERSISALGQDFVADCNMFPTATMCTQLRTLRTVSYAPGIGPYENLCTVVFSAHTGPCYLTTCPYRQKFKDNVCVGPMFAPDISLVGT